MAEISFKNVSKAYGLTKALENVSFTCKEGEFFSIFGPSGAGKTTCLELIAGIKGDYSGNIFLGDQNINSLSVQDRNISMAFENYSLYPHFTVFENIVFPLKSPRAKSRSEQEISEIVTKNATDLGISHLLDRNPSQLSGGQKQRVSLARALVREPQAFLLDEPIAHLDAKLRTVARANLKEIAQRLGSTIVYVTHDYREALALSDTILLLREGKIEQIGSPKDLWNNPQSDFVAHMIGDPVMNLIDGEIDVLLAGEIKKYKPGESINLGVKNAKNDYILVMSAHCVLKKIDLGKLINDSEKYVAIFGNQIPIWEGKKIVKRYLWSHFKNDEVVNMFSENENRYFFHNAISFFKKEFLLANIFDEQIQSKEDRYWAADMINKNHKILYDPSLEVEHHDTKNGATWKDLG